MRQKRSHWAVYLNTGGRHRFYTTKALVEFLKTNAGKDCLVYWVQP